MKWASPFVVVVLFGCKPSPPPYVEPPKRAPEPPRERKWVRTELKDELRVEGSSISEMEVRVEDFGGFARVEARRPFTIGGTQYPATPRNEAAKVPLAKFLGDLDLDELRDGERAVERWKKYRGKNVPDSAKTPERKHEPLDWKVPVELFLTEDGSQKWSGLLPLFKMHPAAAYAVLKGEGALVFEGEDAAPEKPDTLFINFEFEKATDPLRGSGTRMRDVDWIATSTWKPTGQMRKCGGYSRIPGVPGNITVDVALDEVTVRIVDRRTGLELGSKKFPPRAGCPGATSGTTAAIGAKHEDILKWLEKQLAAGKVAAK